MDSAFISSLTEQADQRTPEQHFSWFCLSPKPSGKSTLAELVGWKLASTICHKVLTPILRRGAAATPPAPSAAGISKPTEATLSRRQAAKLAGKTKHVGSDSKKESMSDGVSERSRCSDPGKQQPARAIEEDTPPSTPGPSALKALIRFTNEVESLSDRSTPKRTATSKKRPQDVTSENSASPPRKYITYEVSSTGTSTRVTPPSTSTSDPTVSPNVTDEDLIDIVRCTRRMTDPAMRGKYISDVLSQCSKSSLAAKNGASLEEQYMMNIRRNPPPESAKPKDRPPDERQEQRRVLPKGIPAQVPAWALSRHPMYRHLQRGGPPGFDPQ